MKRKSDNDEDTVAQITRIAVELDLTALAHAIPQLLLQAEQDGISYTDFARTVFDCERRARFHPAGARPVTAARPDRGPSAPETGRAEASRRDKSGGCIINMSRRPNSELPSRSGALHGLG